MATVTDIVDAVDAFMATPKRIVGYNSPPPWGPGFTPNELETKYPLEIDGELRGSHLMVIGFPRERDLKFRIGILFPAMVCRLDYTDETHVNSLDGYLSDKVPEQVNGPHYHSWQLNRRFFWRTSKAPRLLDAVSYSGTGRTFDAILRWFCSDTNIEQLPPGHLIGLPRASTFL
jgi:hypothetical protein